MRHVARRGRKLDVRRASGNKRAHEASEFRHVANLWGHRNSSETEAHLFKQKDLSTQLITARRKFAIAIARLTNYIGNMC